MSNKRKKSNNKIIEFITKNTAKICITLSAFIIAVFIFVLISVVITLSYNKVYEGIFLNEVNVSHMSKEELQEYIEERYTKPLSSVKLNIYANDLEWSLNASDLNIKFNNDNIVDAIFDYGHEGGIFKRLSDINNLKNSNIHIDIWKDENGEAKDLVTYDSSAIDNLVADIIEKVYSEPVQHKINKTDGSVSIIAGTEGFKFSEESLKNYLLSTINNFASDSLYLLDPELSLTTAVLPAELDIDAYCDEIDTEPVDAQYVKNGNSVDVQPGKYGTKVNRSEIEDIAAKLLDINNHGKTFNLTIESIPPKVFAKDLPKLDFRDVLGEGKTSFSGSASNRRHNLELASKTLDGLVLLPGEQFSFNKVVGDTSERNGYKKAPGYSNGGVNDTPGGGICQVSTTLYNAVLRSTGLTVDNRRNHSYSVAYVPLGMDCMISYGSSDFKFTNNTNHPIKLSCEYQSSAKNLVFKILGVNENKDITYEFKTTELSVTKYTESFTTDPKKAQSGKNGGKYSVTKTTKKNGVVIKTETINSTYRAMNKITFKDSNTPVPATPPVSQPPATQAPTPPASTQPVMPPNEESV